MRRLVIEFNRVSFKFWSKSHKIVELSRGFPRCSECLLAISLLIPGKMIYLVGFSKCVPNDHGESGIREIQS